MTPDDTPDDMSGPDRLRIVMPARTRRRGLGPRQVLFVGVAGACALGVGLGLWARPAMSERKAAAIPPTAPLNPPAAVRKLQIVVDDRPAPVGAPIEVLPASAVPAMRTSSPTFVAPPPMAPTRPPQELQRVRAVSSEAQAPAAAMPRKPAFAPLVASAASAVAVAERVIAKAEAHAAASPRLAHADRPAAAPILKSASKHAPVKLAAARPPGKPSPQAHKVQLAHAAAVKAAAHRVEIAKAARAERLEDLKLARAEARGRAEARAEAKAEALAQAQDDARKRQRLASLMHAIQRALPRHAIPHRAAPVELARLDRKPAHKARHEARVEQASLKTRRPRRPAEPPPTRARPLPPPQRASGLMKVSTPRCASRDAGPPPVCASPTQSAAERQLARAYQSARAAGVPDAQLQRDRQRWLTARAAAAREAPWAVHDVYLARIAELNGLAREARGDGY